MGIDVVGESQLVGYPTQFPSVSMMNYNTAEPNARYWVLKLIKDNFGPGDKMMETTERSKDLAAQAFATSKGKKLLLINKRSAPQTVDLPDGMTAGNVSYVAPSTGDGPIGSMTAQGNKVQLEAVRSCRHKCSVNRCHDSMCAGLCGVHAACSLPHQA